MLPIHLFRLEKYITDSQWKFYDFDASFILYRAFCIGFGEEIAFGVSCWYWLDFGLAAGKLKEAQSENNWFWNKYIARL